MLKQVDSLYYTRKIIYCKMRYCAVENNFINLWEISSTYFVFQIITFPHLHALLHVIKQYLLND